MVSVLFEMILFLNFSFSKLRLSMVLRGVALSHMNQVWFLAAVAMIAVKTMSFNIPLYTK